MKNTTKLGTLVLCAAIAACGPFDKKDKKDSNKNGSSTSISELTSSINNASDYMNESLPEYGSASVAAYQMQKAKHFLIDQSQSLSPFPKAFAVATPGTGSSITPNIWDSTNNDHLIEPPGGYPQQNETYANGNAVVHVNLKDHFGHVLDFSYSRDSSDGGKYKPTIFGRLENGMEIIGILGTALPKGFKVGEQSFYIGMEANDSVVLKKEGDANAIKITVQVADISKKSDRYDYAMKIVGAAPLDFENWVWLKNTKDAVNFQHLEYQSRTEDGETFKTMSTSTLAWNQKTGEMSFEYISVDDDSDAHRHGSAMRLYVEEEGGKSYLTSFEGSTSGTENAYNALSMVSTGGDAATETLVSFNFKTRSKSGNNIHYSADDLCVSMADGSLLTSSGCTGLELGELNLNTNLPDFMNNVIAMTLAKDALDRRGLSAWTDLKNPNLGGTPAFTNADDIDAGYAAQ